MSYGSVSLFANRSCPSLVRVLQSKRGDFPFSLMTKSMGPRDLGHQVQNSFLNGSSTSLDGEYWGSRHTLNPQKTRAPSSNILGSKREEEEGGARDPLGGLVRN